MESNDRIFDFGIADAAPAKGGSDTKRGCNRTGAKNDDFRDALLAQILIALKENTFASRDGAEAARALTAHLSNSEGQCVARPDWRPPTGARWGRR